MVRPLLAALVVLVGCGAASAALVVTAPAASACSCVGGGIRDFARSSDVVFAGTLVGRADAADGQVRYTFAVDEVYDGATPVKTQVTSAGDGAACGVEGMRSGEHYVVYAAEHEGDLSTGLCSGTRAAGASYVDKVESLLGPGRQPERSTVSVGGSSAVDDGPPNGAALATVAGGAGVLIVLGLVVGAWRRRRHPEVAVGH